MTTKKITFTKKQITNDRDNFIELEVEKFNFPTEKGDKEIEKISFESSPPDGKIKNKSELENTLRIGGNLELSFDDGKVKIMVIEPEPDNAFHTCCSMDSEPSNQPPKIKVNEQSKTLNIEWNPDIIKIAKQETTNPDSQPQDSKSSNKPKTGDTKNNEDTKGNNSNKENTKKPSQDSSKNKNNDNSNGNDKQTPSPSPQPAPQQPTQEEINNNRESLKQATSGSDKEKLADSIKKNEEIKDKGISQSSEDKTAEEAARKKLAEDKEKYRQTICQTTKDKLEKNGVKKDELGSEAKTKLEKLENGEINEPNQVEEAEKLIIKDTYEKATEKKLTDLENKVNQAVKSSNKKEIEKLQQELTQLISNQNYQSKKSAFEALAKKLESSNTTNANSGDIPWRIIVPVGLVAIVFLVGMLIYARKRKSHSR